MKKHISYFRKLLPAIVFLAVATGDLSAQVVVRRTTGVVVTRRPVPVYYRPWRPAVVVTTIPAGPFFYGSLVYGPTVIVAEPAVNCAAEAPRYVYKDGVYYTESSPNASENKAVVQGKAEEPAFPAGTELSSLPQGATPVQIEGTTYFRCKNMWYKEVTEGNVVRYKAVGYENTAKQ